jgi:hypothetical protein
MADDIDNLVLEQLGRIPASQERSVLDISDLKARASALEQNAGQVLLLLASLSARMDRFDGPLGRIERRLELVES